MEPEDADVDAFANVHAAGDDDDLVLIDSDKPGFNKWSDALGSRERHRVAESCIGKWLSAERLVELTQQRGKKHSTIGFVRGGVKLLHPEEALYLLDEGSLFLQPLKQKTSGGIAASSACNTTGMSVATTLSATVSSKSPPAEASAPASAQLAPVSSDALAGNEAVIPQNGDAQVAPAAASAGVAGAKRRREDQDQTQSAAAAEPDYAAYMPLQASYELLMRNCDPRCVLTYSLLRSQGLVPLRHRKYATPADAAGLGPQPPRRRILFPVPHDEPLLEPVYDVYARDGITSFKPSAPGAPDFYVCVASASEAPPTPSQIARMQWQLKQHSAAARRSQLVKIGDRADLAILTPSEPQVKVAIVAHSTVTFYAMTVSQLGRE